MQDIDQEKRNSRLAPVMSQARQPVAQRYPLGLSKHVQNGRQARKTEYSSQSGFWENGDLTIRESLNVLRVVPHR